MRKSRQPHPTKEVYDQVLQGLRSGEPAAQIARRLGYCARAVQTWANIEGIKLVRGRPSKDTEPVLQCSKCGRLGDSSHVCKGPTLAEKAETAAMKELAEQIEKLAAEKAARSAAVDEFIALLLG